MSSIKCTCCGLTKCTKTGHSCCRDFTAVNLKESNLPFSICANVFHIKDAPAHAERKQAVIAVCKK